MPKVLKSVVHTYQAVRYNSDGHPFPLWRVIPCVFLNLIGWYR